MAIYLITGLPRSGKSFWVVWTTIKKYFNRSKTGVLTLKKEFSNLKIISNIKGLKIPHDSLDELIAKYGSSDKFFCNDSQETISKKYPQIIYLIDECQFFFPEKFSNEKVFNWFQLHGHYGQDIYLITQDKSAIPYKLQRYTEIIRDVIPRSAGIFFGLCIQYNIWQKGVIVDKDTVFKRRWVFDYYTSQNSKETDKVKNPFLKYMVFILIALLFGGWQVSKIFTRHKKETNNGQTNTSSGVPSNKPSPPSNNISDTTQTSKTTVRLSYITDNGIVFIAFNNKFYKFNDFPYPVTNGPFKTLLADIPDSLLAQQKDSSTSSEPKNSPPL